ncbi:MAG: polysaccharide deacetylase family protein [Microscillaceae bacterium]|nr:polysaccharide deacetylase family protein [Microscillaceae bacterium]
MLSKKVIYFLSLFLCIHFSIKSQDNRSLVERLGYPVGTKLLIVHADDIGVSHSENAATFEAMAKGSVNSASILVPCPWLSEVADYYKSHPDSDFGIHLALTSEWKFYKWSPVLGRDKVPSLVNKDGYLYDNVPDVLKTAKLEEAEAELKAQIQKAIDMGIQPTHLDSHMGTLFSSPDMFAIYLKLGRQFGIPVMVSEEILERVPAYKALIQKEDIVIQKILGAGEADFKTGFQDFYSKTLKNLSPGVNLMIIHAAYDDAEMQAITVDHPHWGATWRQQDFDFFSSEACKKILKEQNIQLITWKEIGKLIQK